MSVTELKEALRKINLSTSGRKNDLIVRLTNAVQNTEENTTEETQIQAPVLL